MGWCHEFGPQISEGCDHPMVAGATSCTCAECGAECKGKFAGCADVWARGPRLVAVRATTLRPRTASVRSTARDGTADPEAGSGEASGLGDEALRSLLDELIGRCESFEAVADQVGELARAQGAPRAAPELPDEVAELGRRLDELSARLAPLETLPVRLETLEKAPPPAPTPTPAPAREELASLARDVKRLAGRLSSLDRVEKRVETLDHEQRRLAALDKVLAGLVQGGERLAGRVEALEAAPVPEVAPAGPGPQRAELTELLDRVAALEGAPAAEPPVPAALAEQVERLASRVATLGSAPAAEPRVPAALAKQMERLASQVATLETTTNRLGALERAVAGLTSHPGRRSPNQISDTVAAHLDRLTAEVAPLRAVPKRVEAIERVQGRVNAIDKSLATLTRTVGDLSGKAAATSESEAMPRIEALDAVLAELVQSVGQLSSQVAGLDEVPKRVEALEQASSPSEKLVASIAKRVDRLSTQAASVKELPERVEALEQASPADPQWEQTTQRISEIGTDVQALRAAIDRLLPRVHALDELPPRLHALEQASVPPEGLDSLPDRNEALARGLGHAIDMIDQLAHQVAVLEGSVPAPKDSSG